MAAIELALVVELERARMFAIVGGVGVRSRGDHHGTSGQRHELAGSIPAAILLHLIFAAQRRHRAVSVGDALHRIEAFGETNAFFERLDDFFVIEAIGGRILQAFAIDDGHAAPGPDQAIEVRLAASGRGGGAFRANGPAVLQPGLDDLPFLLIQLGPDRLFADLADQAIVAVERLFRPARHSRLASRSPCRWRSGRRR